jgi:hypothetical protein
MSVRQVLFLTIACLGLAVCLSLAGRVVCPHLKMWIF